MKIVSFFAVLVTGLLLLSAVKDFPDWADGSSPASTHVSPYYLTKSMEDTAVPNVVTSVLADYRGFDTMFETAVIFSAGIAVILVLRKFGKRAGAPEDDSMRDLAYRDRIIQMVARQMVPFIQLFALYVVAHGHHSPGGGFQGGVILGASFILLALSYNLKMMLARINERSSILLGNIGVLIYAGIGITCVFLGANFLDYSVLSTILPATDAVHARSHGMLGVEIGVAIAVTAIMVLIYENIASEGKLEKGL